MADVEPRDAPEPWQVTADELTDLGDVLPDEPADGGRVADVVRRDLDALFSAHPAADTLRALAVRLAAVVDAPDLDGRTVAAVARELRATVADLVAAEEDDEDDLFGAGGPAPVVVPASG